MIKANTAVFQIVIVYSAPTTKYEILCSFLKEKIFPYIDTLKPFIVMGDFNINSDNGNSPFVQFVSQELRCSQLIKMPTTNNESTIDLIFTNQKNVKNGVTETPWSDHKAIWAAV